MTSSTLEDVDVPLIEIGPSREATCNLCGASIVMNQINFKGRSLFPSGIICNACDQAERDRHKEALWKHICPPLFLDNDPEKIGKPLMHEVYKWLLSDQKKGLGLIGKNRIGKTRAMWFIRKELFKSGIVSKFYTMAEFANIISDRFHEGSNGEWEFERLKRVRVLFLDDIGKERLTERVQVDFLDLVDTRMRNCKPILWSSNKGGDEMYKSSKDDAEADRMRAILLRLIECCDVRKF